MCTGLERQQRSTPDHQHRQTESLDTARMASTTVPSRYFSPVGSIIFNLTPPDADEGPLLCPQHSVVVGGLLQNPTPECVCFPHPGSGSLPHFATLFALSIDPSRRKAVLSPTRGCQNGLRTSLASTSSKGALIVANRLARLNGLCIRQGDRHLIEAQKHIRMRLDVLLPHRILTHSCICSAQR